MQVFSLLKSKINSKPWYNQKLDLVGVKDCPYRHSADIWCDNSVQWLDIEYPDTYAFRIYISFQTYDHATNNYILPIDFGGIILFLCFEIHHTFFIPTAPPPRGAFRNLSNIWDGASYEK